MPSLHAISVALRWPLYLIMASLQLAQLVSITETWAPVVVICYYCESAYCPFSLSFFSIVYERTFFVSELQLPVIKHWHRHVPTQMKVPATCWLSRTSAVNWMGSNNVSRDPVLYYPSISSVPLCFDSRMSVGRCLLITVQASSSSEIV